MEIKPEMNLEIGSEEKFRKFICGVGANERVALISHNDLDGVSCPKIISEFIKPVDIRFVDYPDLNKDLAESLRKHKINKVVFTDLYIHDEGFLKELEEFSEVLIIDHHRSPDWNSDRTTFVKGEDGYSATYLCYYLFSKIKNIAFLDWLVACTCISDYCHKKPERWLSAIMRKYGDSLKYEGLYVRQSGPFWELIEILSMALIYFRKNPDNVYEKIGKSFGEIGNLGDHAKEVLSEIDKKVREFETGKEIFSRGYFFMFKSKFKIKSVFASIVSGKEIHKVFVIVEDEGELYKISVRRQDQKFDCNKFLQGLVSGVEGAQGGGHVPAAGGHFQRESLPEIRERLGLNPIKTFK